MPSQISLSQVSEAILAYLRHHPGAADTAEGIACWWLPASLQSDPEMVMQALEALLAQSRIRCHVNTDRHIIYSCLPGRKAS
jgi:hypothetical protein